MSDQRSTDDWYVATENGPAGPYSRVTLAGWVEEGRIDAATLIWREGMDDWTELRRVIPVLPPAYMLAAAHPRVSDVRGTAVNVRVHQNVWPKLGCAGVVGVVVIVGAISNALRCDRAAETPINRPVRAPR
jgi:hypothetical protein